MTRPTDDDGQEAVRFTAGLLFGMISAKQADAESPAGPEPYMHIIPGKVTTSPERVQIPAESEHDAAALEIGRKAWAEVPDAAAWQRETRGTEPATVRCPRCTASLPAGKTCGGTHCGLKETK